MKRPPTCRRRWPPWCGWRASWAAASRSNRQRSTVICRAACGARTTASAPGYQRALDMLLAKLKDQPFITEVPIHAPEKVEPAMPIRRSVGGHHRHGHHRRLGAQGQTRDKQVAANASRYYRHSVAELQSLSGADWEAYHAGYFNHIVNSNPNYILPLNFLRDPGKPTAKSAASSVPSTRCRASPRRSPCPLRLGPQHRPGPCQQRG